MKTGRCILFFVLFCFSGQLAAQGCSDAGICTAPAQPGTEGATDSLRQHLVKLTGSWGIGEQGVSVFQVVPEAELSIAKNWRALFKVPFCYTAGNLGKASGTGDITAGFAWIRKINANAALRFSLLGKLATGKTNRLSDALLPLPMPYQPGLGTHDLVGAVSFHYKSWLFSGAYQQVITNNNSNAFLHSSWNSSPEALLYFESAALRRGNDAMLRAEKTFTWNTFRFSPGMLAIYRLQQDDVNGGAVVGSDGLTLNVTATGSYRMKNQSVLTLVAGKPVIVREMRPDGLTRALVLNLTFTYPFVLTKKQ